MRRLKARRTGAKRTTDYRISARQRHTLEDSVIS